MAGPSIDRARLPFAEQVAFFRGKLGTLMPTERWTDVWRSQHDRAWMVAGAQKADLLADLAGAVDRAIAEGESLDRFRARFDEIVADHGWAYRGPRNWRTRTIYRANMATSYSAGRLAQLRDPELQRIAPYWRYRHNDAVETPRPAHLSWDGTTLPADHPWWQSHYPPGGWGCECDVEAVTEAEAAAGARRSGRPVGEAPDDGLQPDGTPVGIDRGWDYMPGDTVTDDIRRAVSEKAETLPGPLGRALADEVADPPPPPAADLPAYREEATLRGAQRLAQEILDSPGPVPYQLDAAGAPLVRFQHGRSSPSRVRERIYGRATYAGLDVQTANAVNRELLAMQAECDRLGLPRLRGVKTGAGAAAATMGDGVLSISKALTVTPRYQPKVSSAAPGAALRDKPSVSPAYFEDPVDALRATLWHEFGHHVHQQRGVVDRASYLRPPLEEELRRWVGGLDQLVIPTRYAATNSKELWAESYTLYKLGREAWIDARLAERIREIEEGKP